MEKPDRREVNGDVTQGSNDPDGREQADVPPENDSTAEGPTEEVSVEGAAEDVERDGTGAEESELDELRRRIKVKDRHIRELHDELAAARLAADEAQARAEAGQSRVGDLEEERAEIKEKLRAFEEEERKRRRRRERQDRRVARLEREIERREAEIGRLEDLLEERENEIDAYKQEVQDFPRRVEELQRDLEERENLAAELQTTIDMLRAELDLEYELRRHMAEPENRLRAGIDLFNKSEHRQLIGSISKSLGHPEIHVSLGDGDEPPVILTFVWPDITWRVYIANPGLGVEEPRVYLESVGEDFSDIDSKPSNAHIGPGGQVFLGL